MAMTEQQKRFANEYLVHLNGTKAYKIAYGEDMSDEVASTSASRLLRNAKVKDYIDKRIKDRLKRIEVEQDDVVNELSKVAFGDPTEVVNIITKIVTDKDGVEHRVTELTYTETKNLPDNVKAMIKSIKPNARGLIEVEFHDKMKALELLGRHLGMYTDNINANADIEGGFKIEVDYGEES